MNRVTPENVQSLADNEIFVFGSNMSGRHGAGAAKFARTLGAKYGQPVGLQGQTYAIPTVNKTVDGKLSIDQIEPYVNNFINFAQENTQYHFLVTEIGCGLAGHRVEDIAPLFKKAEDIENISLPIRFWQILL